MKNFLMTILFAVTGILCFLAFRIPVFAAENNELNYNYYYEYTYNQNGRSGMARREYSSEDELILIVDYDITGSAGGHSGSEGIIAPVYSIALVTPETGELVLTNSTSIYSYTKPIRYRTIYPGSTSWTSIQTIDVPYMKTINSNGKVSYGSMLYYYDGLETNMKLFSSVEAAYEYATTGNDDGQINKDVPEVYEKNLGYLQNVRYFEDTQTDAKGNRVRTSHITWSTDSDFGSDVFIEIKADNFYKKWFSDKITERVSFVSYSDGLSYVSGSYSFPTTKPSFDWIHTLDYGGFWDMSVQTYGTTDLYIRPIRYNADLKQYDVGGWVRIDIERGTSSELPTSNVNTGNFDEDTGYFVPDTSSEDSYRYHLSQSGNDNTNVTDGIDNGLKHFSELVENVGSMVSSLSASIATFFSWLPWWSVAALGGIIVVCVILRILGR